MTAHPTITVSISEAEKLAAMSTREKVASFKFGPGWVALVGSPENEWAIKQISEWRAEAWLRSETD